MGKCSETSRDAIGVSDWDRIMRGRPHAQERAMALIKSGVQMMRQSVAISEGVCRLGSEAAHRPAKGTAYGTSTATSVLGYQEDPAFMKRITTGDEIWCHHYEPGTKRDSMQWKHASSPPPKKFRAVKSAGKVLLTVFFDVQGPLLVEFLEHRKSINSDAYCETLRRLRWSIKNKRPGLLKEGVVLLHDNAHPHVSRVTQMELDKFKWETLDLPPCSPDMSPCDFHVFDPLKKTPEREALQLRRRTQGHCEGLSLVTATGTLGTRNPTACSLVGSLCSGLWCIF
ncbi:histone-lysine N-methyltransferase SETMAR [Trichonephila clavipes]|nr:histone-lysine N-methyltransferase SETMAR [Trichonephila clavipes]